MFPRLALNSSAQAVFLLQVAVFLLLSSQVAGTTGVHNHTF
jgi:hypothetical protein